MDFSTEDQSARTPKTDSSEEPTSIVAIRPELSEEEQQTLFEVAAWQVAAAVCGWQVPSVEERLAVLASRPVLGSFVTLKRANQLRSCCGYLGGSIRLGEAVQQAAIRAAKDDPRFPPIEPEELDRLHMDVWLLWNMEPVPGRGEERRQGFQIGKHGLQVIRGHARGLLLPSVAVEHGLGVLADVQGLAGIALNHLLVHDRQRSDTAGAGRHLQTGQAGPEDQARRLSPRNLHLGGPFIDAEHQTMPHPRR